MSAEEKRYVDREMTRGLCTALDPVIAGHPEPLAFEAARNVAQLLVLPGLDRLLAVMAEHGTADLPPEVRHATDRLRRERERALAQSSLVNFYEAEPELAALATYLEGLEWNAASSTVPAEAQAPREAVIGLASALGSVRFHDGASEAVAARVRLTAAVAAVLRAALDWMFGDAEQRAVLRVSEDGGTIEVECRGIDPEGLLPAHEVIGAVGGSLGVASGAEPGVWVLRLPAASERETFLMLQQNDLWLALPWSNVLRIQLETAEDEPLSAPPLAPLRPLTGARRGRPVVTVGLGLRRGSLAVDRLVWRLAADPCRSEMTTPAGVTRAVQTDDGERFWVIDVAKLMRDVPLPALPEPPEAVSIPLSPPREAPVRGPAREAAPAVAPVAGEAGRSAAPAPPKLILLKPENVETLRDMPAPGRTLELGTSPPAPAGAGAPRVAPASARTPAVVRWGSAAPAAPRKVAPSAGHARRALIAEDSFMARIFLMRLLQAQGYNVHSVGTASELRDVISSEDWALVCVDTDLPDARGAALIREVSDSQLDRPEPAVVVALVRDWTDQQAAASGGVHRVLLKPFSQREVAAMLERAGLPAAGPR